MEVYHSAFAKSMRGFSKTPSCIQCKPLQLVLECFRLTLCYSQPLIPNIYLIVFAVSSIPACRYTCWLAGGKPKLSEGICKVLRERAGVSARVITPSDLRLIPDHTSPTGYSLYAVCRKPQLGTTVCQDPTHDNLEPVRQIGLYLYQDEFRRLSLEMLQHIALWCVNDIRTILLVADKRILGVVLQELDNLVNDLKVLTAEQARILRDGIVSTILPGSSELKTLISESRQPIPQERVHYQAMS